MHANRNSLQSPRRFGFLTATLLAYAACATGEPAATIPITHDSGPAVNDSAGPKSDGNSIVDGARRDADAVEEASIDVASLETSIIDAAMDATVDATSRVDAPLSGAVRINEVYLDVTLDEGARGRYVEIATPPNYPLDGLKIRVIDETGSSPAKKTYALSKTPGARANANGLWVVGGTLVSNVDEELSITTSGDDWDLDSTKGAIQLLFDDGSGPQLLDVVGYGGTIPSPSSPPTTTVEGQLAPRPSARGESIGRQGNVDTNNNASDFCVQASSPGQPNRSCVVVQDAASDSTGTNDANDAATASDSISVSDAPAPSNVRINEIYIGVDFQSANTEYVEISGPPGASLNGLWIRVIDGTGVSPAKRTYSLGATTGAVFPSSGRWVIGGRGVSGTVNRELDISTSTDDWNLDNDKGSVQLFFDGSNGRTLLDVVGYGGAVVATSTLSPPTQTAEGTPVTTMPTTSGRSIGRRSGGSDTNNNAADFCVQSATSGGANAACQP